MDNVEGKVVVVTGAAGGIGLAIARRLGRDGARVVIADIEAEVLVAAADELTALGIDAEAVVTDVTDLASVEALAQRSLDRFGSVDVVCNNAGAVLGGRAWEVDVAAWRRLMDVNFWGVVHGIHAFVPILLEQGSPAHVVNTASMAGVMTLGSLGPYVASKHAVVSLSEVLVQDLASVGAAIGVSVLCPGMVATHLGRPDRTAPLDTSAPGVISADATAGFVADAIATRRFYVFTHPRTAKHVRARVDPLLVAADEMR
jgi:NADP-dependent 3-hydroxy acid dehydrogenase YdfG